LVKIAQQGEPNPCPWRSTTGFACALTFYEATAVEDQIKNFIIIFTGIFYEALPFIVFGAVVAGIVEELIPQRLIARLIPRNRVLAIAIGGLLGLPSPMCDCGILVVVRRLLRKGVPLSCCICYLLAGPIINVVTMLSTRVAFNKMEELTDASGHLTYQIGGTGMMTLRVGMGYLVAFITGLIIEWQYRKHGPNKLLTPLAVPVGKTDMENDPEEATPRSLFQRLNNITETALHDFVDVMVFVVLGALLAALGRLLLKDELETLSRSYPVFSIGIMMVLAIVLCICSQADAFVAASFITVRPASKLAFLVLGPMLDFKLYAMYTRVFRPRLIWTVVSCVVIQVFVFSLVTHIIWENYHTQITSWLAELGWY
jgi:uncharacterized membrane protein YraQ (UPF0718 family)